MYYRIEPDSELFSKVEEALNFGIDARNKALILAHEHGAKGIHELRSPEGLYGGISCFVFEEKPGDLWKKVETPYGTRWYPKKNRKENKPLLDKIKALPVLSCFDFNKLLNYRMDVHNSGNKILWSPSINAKLTGDKKYIHIGFTKQVIEGGYIPPEGMTEVTYSEFKRS